MTESLKMKEALFYKKGENRSVNCSLCAHRCSIPNGAYGRCGVRKNINNTLFSTIYGLIIANNIDPVEKKPLYHFLPGTKTYSIASPGCNFTCKFCQNWHISQIKKEKIEKYSDFTEPESIVTAAIKNNCKSISYTYTEPTVFYEIMKDVSTIASGLNIRNIMVSNGFMTMEALELIIETIDAFNIDLKSFSDDFYKNYCGARLKPVLDTLNEIKKTGKWLEITTLIIPGINDSKEEIESIAEFIAELGTEIPWHVSRFFPTYKMGESYPTPELTLEIAVEAAKKFGLKYVYIGNTARKNYTRCWKCEEVIIERDGFFTFKKINNGGKCIKCGEIIDGVWE